MVALDLILLVVFLSRLIRLFNLAKSKRIILQETWALYLVFKSLNITRYEKESNLTTNDIQQLRVWTTKSWALLK